MIHKAHQEDDHGFIVPCDCVECRSNLRNPFSSQQSIVAKPVCKFMSPQKKRRGPFDLQLSCNGNFPETGSTQNYEVNSNDLAKMQDCFNKVDAEDPRVKLHGYKKQEPKFLYNESTGSFSDSQSSKPPSKQAEIRNYFDVKITPCPNKNPKLLKRQEKMKRKQKA